MLPPSDRGGVWPPRSRLAEPRPLSCDPIYTWNFIMEKYVTVTHFCSMFSLLWFQVGLLIHINECTCSWNCVKLKFNTALHLSTTLQTFKEYFCFLLYTHNSWERKIIFFQFFFPHSKPEAGEGTSRSQQQLLGKVRQTQLSWQQTPVPDRKQLTLSVSVSTEGAGTQVNLKRLWVSRSQWSRSEHSGVLGCLWAIWSHMTSTCFPLRVLQRSGFPVVAGAGRVWARGSCSVIGDVVHSHLRLLL